MLVLRQIAPTAPDERPHLIARKTYRPLCKTRLDRPDAWAIVPVRPGTVRICAQCWRRRFAALRLV